MPRADVLFNRSQVRVYDQLLSVALAFKKAALCRWLNIFDKLCAPRDLTIPRRSDRHDLQRRLPAVP